MKNLLDKIKHSSALCKPRHKNGFSLPEVLIGSALLASAVGMSAQLTNSTTKGMQNMDMRTKLDSAIAAHIEEIRDSSFRHLCIQGCADNELTQQLRYDLATLKPLCASSSLGSSLLADLNTKGLTSNFYLTDYNPSATPLLITSSITSSGNQVNVNLTENTYAVAVSTTIVPHAQGWCP